MVDKALKDKAARKGRWINSHEIEKNGGKARRGKEGMKLEFLEMYQRLLLATRMTYIKEAIASLIYEQYGEN